jgi:hypothetical protein
VPRIRYLQHEKSRFVESDVVIINQVRQNGVERPLAASDVVMLHNEGVSDAVIAAMQQSPGPVVAAVVSAASPPPASAPPVVIEEYRYVAPPPPRYYVPVRPYYGPRWGFYR